MLTVYSAHGSPGASTTALYLAAHWASTGQEVLLLEADPAGGSMSHHLGIQFTPGSASFVASGLPVGGANLIDHSQDVLFNNLHVMPSTSSPAGARGIVAWFAQHAGELRDVSEREMAVIIDGGRITADSAVADLTAHAAGVVVVARGDSAPTSLEHIGSLLSSETRGEGVERCAVTIGESPMSAEEWREQCDVTFCGSIRDFSEMTGDLAAFLNRNKRKSKRWRVSLEEVAEQLLPLAKPPESEVPRVRQSAPVTAEPAVSTPPDAAPPEAPRAPAHDSAVEEQQAAAAMAAPGAEGAHPPPAPEAPPQFEDQPPAPPPGYFEAPQPAHAEGAPPVHTAEPVYYEPPPPAPEPVYSAHPEMPVPAYQPPPAAEPPPQYEQPPVAPPAYHEPSSAPSGYGPPGAAPPAYDQPPPAPPEHPHAAVPSPGYHEPPSAPPAHGRPPGPPAAPAYPVPQQQTVDHRHPATQQPTVPQQPPTPPPYPHPAAAEPPAAPSDITPSGSFRDWAARLHGPVPQGTAGAGGGDVS